jgi:hypothetical protein
MIDGKAFRDYANQSNPFSLFLADGRQIAVRRGEHIAVHPNGRMFLFWKPGGGFELFNLTMVTSVKFESGEKSGSQ